MDPEIPLSWEINYDYDTYTRKQLVCVCYGIKPTGVSVIHNCGTNSAAGGKFLCTTPKNTSETLF